MEAKEFISLLKDPSLLNRYALDDLIRMAEEYPYTQYFYPLIAKKAHIVNDGDYERWLNKAAIRSIDRKQLYRFIHQSELEMPEVEEKQKEVTETKVEKPKVKSRKKELSVEKKPKQKTTTRKKGRKKNTVESKPKEKAKHPTEEEARKVSIAVQKKGKKTIPPKIKKSEVPRQAFKGKHTFTEWFKYIKAKPSAVTDEIISPEASYEARIIKESASEQDSFPITKTLNLLEEDIEEKKQVSPDEEQTVSKLAADSIESDSEMITETLAKIYEIQKKYDKAIDAYERLILKYPDKKAYFAQKIEKLKSN